MAYGFNNDKSKVEIYSKTEVDGEIGNVNDRIDNIITSPAPTEQEIIDARLGADGVTYPSLGDAIRDQVSDLKSDITSLKLLDTKRLFDWAIGGWGINGEGEANFSSGSALKKRRSCPHTLQFDHDVTLLVHDTQNCRFSVDTFADYSTSKIPAMSTLWVTCPVTIPANTEFEFTVSWTNESASSDTTNLYNGLYDTFSIISIGDANDIREKGEIISKYTGIEIIRPDFNRGYLNSGNIVVSSLYNYSQKIIVNEGDIVRVKSNGSGATAICLYDNSDVSIKYINFVTGQNDYILKAVQSGYVRTCSLNSYSDYLVTVFRTDGFYAKTETEFENIENEQTSILESIKDVVDLKYNYDWVVGGWWANGTSNPPNYSATAGTAEQRIASKSYVVFDEDVTIFVDDVANYRLGDIYTADDTTYTEEGWTSSRVFKAGRKYWITLAYVTENKPDITDPYNNDVFNNVHVRLSGNIVDIRQRVSALEEKLPSYWQTTIDNIVDTLNNNAVDFENHGDSFVFITDQHWVSNAQVSSKLIDYISERVDLSLVINGGDLINNKNASKTGAINEIVNYYKSFSKPHRIFSAIGNHDINNVANSDTSTYLTTAELYPLMIKREEKFTDTKGTELVNVFDNTSQKIRYIQICCYGNSFNSTIQTMLTDAITEKDSSWTIVLISHAYWLNSETVATSFANAILSAMDEADATVACWLVGHMHDDKDTTLTSTGGKTLTIIATSTDSYGQMHAGGDVPYTMTRGTTTEQCFDVVQIDTTAKTIKMTRVGVGSDRSFSY